MRTLRVGVIGLGVGEEHVAAFAAHGACRVVALCDRDRERLNAAGARHPQARLVADASDLLADPDVEVVSIASYDDDHCDHVVAALHAGKDVFVEKPMCRSAAELARVRSAWEGTDRELACNLVLRAAPLYVWIRERIAKGGLGSLYAFDGDYLYGRLEKITHGWRGRVDDYSVMAGGGVHLVDLMLGLTGQRPHTVSAVGNRISSEGAEFRYHDFVAATFEFESGMVGRVTANFGCVHPHQHVVRIFGTEMTFLHDDCGARLRDSRDPGRGAAPLDLAPLPESKGALIPSFVDDVLAGRRNPSRVRHEFDVVSACVYADEALRTGERVRIRY